MRGGDSHAVPDLLERQLRPAQLRHAVEVPDHPLEHRVPSGDQAAGAHVRVQALEPVRADLFAVRRRPAVPVVHLFAGQPARQHEDPELIAGDVVIEPELDVVSASCFEVDRGNYFARHSNSRTYRNKGAFPTLPSNDLPTRPGFAHAASRKTTGVERG